LELGIDTRGSKTRMVGLPDGRKSFKIGLAVQTQYWHVTDRHATTTQTTWVKLVIIRQQKPNILQKVKVGESLLIHGVD